MKRRGYNDEVRWQWCLNDEGLYNLAKSSKSSITKFVRENRKFIDEVIDNVTNNKKQAHYLVYG